MKKLLYLFLCCIAALAVRAEEGTYTEEIAGIKWTFKIENGVAIIREAEQSNSGDVEIPDTLKKTPVCTTLGSLITSVFNDPDKATGAILPSSITNIGRYTFYSCTSLSFADLSAANNLKYIGENAFDSCSMLTTLEIPNSCLNIDDGAFSDCSSLVDVILPGKMTSLGSSAFKGCSMLQSVAMPTNLTGIARSTFSGCSALKAVTLPANLKTIAQYAFENCSSIKKITIPNTVTTLGAYSFNGCSSLTEVTFEGGIPSGLKNSHLLDKVTNVNCPEPLYDTYKNWLTENGYTCTVNNIGEPDKELKTDGTWYYHIVDGSYAELWCTNGAGNNVCALVNPQTVGTLTLPDTLGGYVVKGVAPLALSNLRGITGVTIPNTYETIGAYAFSNCTSLAEIYIPYGIRSIGKRAFMNTIITALTLPDSVINLDGNIAAGALFDLGNALEDSSHFLVAEDGAVYNRDQTKLYACPTRQEGTIVLPNTLTEIGADAFFGCFRLTYLNIPNGVNKIGTGAFNTSGIWNTLNAPESKSKLEAIFFNSSEPPIAADDIFSGAPTMMVYAFSENWTSPWKGQEITIISKADPPVLNYKDEYDLTWKYRIIDNQIELVGIEPKSTQGQLITSKTDTGTSSQYALRIPATINGYTVQSIGTNAFAECTSLIRIGIPASVTKIGARAFSGCTALQALAINNYKFPYNCTDGLADIPVGVRKIGEHLFEGSAISSIYIPYTLTDIDGNPGAGCEFITQIEVDTANPKFSTIDEILYNKSQTVLVGVPANLDLQTLTIPASIVEIGSESLLDCKNISSIALPSSLQTIGTNALSGCSKILKLTIPASTTEIQCRAFSNCSLLTNVTFNGNCPTTDGTIYTGTKNVNTYCNKDATGWPTESTWEDRPLVKKEKQDSREEDPVGRQEYTDDSGNTWLYTVENGEAILGHWGEVPVLKNADTAGTIKIPETLGGYPLSEIPDEAFINCKNISCIEIPATIASIGSDAFNGCTALEEFKVSTANQNYTSRYGVLYTKDGKTLVKVPAKFSFDWSAVATDAKTQKKLKIISPHFVDDGDTMVFKPAETNVLSVGTTTTSISATNHTATISQAKLFAGVTRIGNYAFTDCGKVTLPNNTQQSKTLSAIATANDNGTAVEATIIEETITYDLYEVLRIPASVTTIGQYATYGSYFTEIGNETISQFFTAAKSGNTTESTIGEPLTPSSTIETVAKKNYCGWLENDGIPTGTVTLKTSAKNKLSGTVLPLGEKKFTVKNLEKLQAYGNLFLGEFYEGYNGKVWTAVLETVDNDGEPLLNGLTMLSLTVKSKGKVNVTGYAADGTKISTTAQLAALGEEIYLPITIQLYTGKKGGFSVLFKIENGNPILVKTSPLIYKTAIAEIVPVDAGVPSSITIGSPIFELPNGYTIPANASWKPRYTAKTGIITGSFKILDPKSKKKTAKLYGIVVNGIGYATTVISKIASMSTLFTE